MSPATVEISWPGICPVRHRRAVRIGLAGRSAQLLADLRTRLGAAAPAWPVLAAGSASAGTHYADLSGEVLYIRESIDRFNQVAACTGSRIVHCCGFDCIPSGLGVLLLHRAARTDYANDLEDKTLVVTAPKGGKWWPDAIRPARTAR